MEGEAYERDSYREAVWPNCLVAALIKYHFTNFFISIGMFVLTKGYTLYLLILEHTHCTYLKMRTKKYLEKKTVQKNYQRKTK